MILPWTRRYVPIILIEAYLTITVLFFAFSPWDYTIENAGALYAFLVAVQIALLAGYVSVVRRAAPPAGVIAVSRRFFIAATVTQLLLLYPTAAFRTGGEFSVIGAIMDPGAAYAASRVARDINDSPIEYVRLLFGPLLVAPFPLTVYYWGRLSRRLRILGVAAISGHLSIYVATGTNKAIMDAVLLIPWVLLASMWAGISQMRRKHVLGALLALVVAFGAALAFFGQTQQTREGSAAVFGSFSAAGATADYDHPLMRGLPFEGQVVMLGLNSYVTQGYYALSLAITEPFEPMWGVGNSMFLTRQAVRLTGDESIEERSYPAKIEKYGWDRYLLWSSLYAWLASDVSWIGVVALMFLVGRLFAAAWLGSLGGGNPFAPVMLWMVVMVLLYAPANNQALQSGEGFTAFFGTLLAWALTRAKVPSAASSTVHEVSA